MQSHVLTGRHISLIILFARVLRYIFSLAVPLTTIALYRINILYMTKCTVLQVLFPVDPRLKNSIYISIYYQSILRIMVIFSLRISHPSIPEDNMADYRSWNGTHVGTISRLHRNKI